MESPFVDRLIAAIREKRSLLSVGLDPRPAWLPEAVRPESDDLEAQAEAVLRFHRTVIDLVAPHAVAVKPQIAFHEALGPAGMETYRQSILYAREQGLLVIGDVKRGDIGSTSEAYARAHLAGPFAADAITLSPYLGLESLDPFIDRAAAVGAGLFVLIRTSNPGADWLQEVPAAPGTVPLYLRLTEGLAAQADRLRSGTSGWSGMGGVVGATCPEAGPEVRRRLGRSFLLVPGVGAQGGAIHALGGFLDGESGLGILVSASRSVTYPWRFPRPAPVPADWQQAVRAAAEAHRERLRPLLPRE